MSDIVAILTSQLDEARSQADLPRQVALAVALLRERGVDTQRLLMLITEASQVLISRDRGDNLETALGWAQTWSKHTRQPAAREMVAELSGRVLAVKDAEQRLRAVSDGSDPMALRTALTFFDEHPQDRVEGTAALVAEARNVLARVVTETRRKATDRLRRAGEMRARIEALVPGELDSACALLGELAAIDPTSAEEPSLVELPVRLVAAQALHAAVEDALKHQAIPPLESALATLEASGDRLAGSSALIARGESEIASRRARCAACGSALSAVDPTRIDLASALADEIALLDPAAGDTAGAAALRSERARIEELHRRVDAGIITPTRPDFAAAVADLAAAPRRFATSAELVTQGQAALAALARRIEERRRRIRMSAIAAGVLLVCLLIVWGRDAAGSAAIDRAQPAEALVLARAFAADGSHLFYRASAAERAERLSAELDARELAAAEQAGEPNERIARAEAYLRRTDARRQPEARALIARSRLELGDRAFAAANGVGDIDRRIAALGAYARSTDDATRADLALRTISELQRGRDEQVWATVTAAPDAATRLTRLDAYLATPGVALHVDEARTLRAETAAAIDRRRATDQDDAAWAAVEAVGDPAQAVAAIERYLAGDTLKAHAEQARGRIGQLQQMADDQAWSTANAKEGAASERIVRLQAYLAGTTLKSHADEARRTIADLVWASAQAAVDPAERLVAVRAYLADPANQLHRERAQRVERDLVVAIDRVLWDKARTEERPLERIQALQAYVTAPGEHTFALAARDEIAAAARQLADQEPALIATLPDDLLATLPPAQLSGLPAERLAKLPVPVQARVVVKPAWSSNAGIDDTGRWALVPFGKQSLRLRWIPPGMVMATVGNGLVGLNNDRGFWLAEQEVNQAAWTEAMGGFFSDNNPSTHAGPDLPVHGVLRTEADEFIAVANRRFERDGVAARVRLPASPEWLIVAATQSEGLVAFERGSSRPYNEREVVQMAWTSDDGTGPRATSAGRADRWGLIDMLGNVTEWCSDAQDGGIARGGAWNAPRAEARHDRVVRPAARQRDPGIGLRLVVEDR